MKVYQVNLKKYQPFYFYFRDGLITPTCDEKYPCPLASTLWKNDETWIYKYRDVPDKLVCPAVCVKKTDYYEYVKLQMQPLIETLIAANGDKVLKNNYNIFIIKREADRSTLEVGLFGHEGFGLRRNNKIQKICNSILNMKAFW